jgi:hypothetical protein
MWLHCGQGHLQIGEESQYATRLVQVGRIFLRLHVVTKNSQDLSVDVTKLIRLMRTRNLVNYAVNDYKLTINKRIYKYSKNF